MPGWYVHLEAGHLAAERLRSGDLPQGYPLTVGEAAELGDIAHRWRNYLAAGALGPDLFFGLPDYKAGTGAFLLNAIEWVLDTWQTLDDDFISKWEKWVGPISTDLSLIEANLTGGVLNEIGEGLNDLSASVFKAFETLVTRFGDLWGLLSSGVPQGVDNSAFFWSDIFHYRKTMTFPWQLYKDAAAARSAARAAGDDDAAGDAEGRMAFAIGWMCHCGTDVIGHSFTNTKVGGPYRTHWQRHHLIENHMDSQNYGVGHGSSAYYEMYGKSALHFRLAFRDAGNPPPDPAYAGRADQPAYDYFTGFPAYDLSESALGDQNRHQFYDLDTNDLPDHLKQAIIDTMGKVFPNDGPQVLTHDPAFSTTDSATGQPTGRPNETAMAEMWQLVYRYLKFAGSDGFSPSLPPPPAFINDHPFPTPPGSSSVGDDPSRGADPDDNSFNLLDLLLAIFAWIIYIGEVIVWLLTVLPGLIIDIATFPLREALYWAFVVPAWNLYLLSRRMLVMEAYLMPRPEEVDRGLVTMGVAPGNPWPDLIGDLFDPTGYYTGPPSGTPFDEPSGRTSPGSEWDKDSAYPRAIVTDSAPVIAQLGLVPGPLLSWIPKTPSEWVAPWNYPQHAVDGSIVGWEAALTHAGPWVQGDQTSLLLTNIAGDPAATADYESAKDPATTEAHSATYIPQNRTLGGPVDYSLHIIGALTAAAGADTCPLPDMNLDSDRGYAAHTWDWVRHTEADGAAFLADPKITSDPAENLRYLFRQPCTVPQGYDPNWSPSHTQYDFQQALRIHYLDPDAPAPKACDPKGSPIDPRDRDRAGIPPEGEPKR
jgi:hypothetical protein